MDVDRFVITDDNQKHAIQQLACHLCHKVPTNASTCLSARHFFCKECIERHLQTSSTCPVDEEPLEPGQLSPSPFHHTMLAMFKIRCDNRRRTVATSNCIHRGTRCAWLGAIPDLSQHQSECPFRSVACSACGQTVLATYLDVHYQRCPQKSVNCQLCHVLVPNEKLPTHYDECPSASVYCPNHCVAQSGLSEALVLRRRDVRAHLKVCPNRVYRCEFAEMGCKFRGNPADSKKHMENNIQDHLRLVTKSHAKIVDALKSLGVVLASEEQTEEKGRDGQDPGCHEKADTRPASSHTALTSGDSVKPSESTCVDAIARDDAPLPTSTEGTHVAKTKRRRFDPNGCVEYLDAESGGSCTRNTSGDPENRSNSVDVDPASPATDCKNRIEGRNVSRRKSLDWNQSLNNGDPIILNDDLTLK